MKIEIMLPGNLARDEWAYDGAKSDTIGLFLPNGFCALGFTFTGWKRRITSYWHIGIIILNMPFGIWHDDDM